MEEKIEIINILKSKQALEHQLSLLDYGDTEINSTFIIHNEKANIY